MQLKSLAKSTEVLNKVTSVLNNTELSHLATKQALEDIGKSYTTETLKAAMAQSTLNEKQIEAILYANGLRGEILKTTTAEVVNAASTNAVAASQATTTGTTIGLGTAFEGLGIAIKKATLAMAKFLFTTPAGWATLAVSAIAGVVFGVKQYRENITKAAEESKEAINEISESYKKLNSTVSDIKQKYAELAQSVNQFTGKNKSLSNDEYAEFLDLSNQLAELFPSLSKRYDENGNAILNLSGNVNTIVDSLTNLVEVEKQLSSQKILAEIPNVLKGYSQNRSDFDKELKNLEKWQRDLRIAYQNLQNINKVYETGFMNNNSGFLEVVNVLGNLGIDFKTIDDDERFGYGTIVLENYDDSLDKISRSLKTVTLDISNMHSKIKSENADFNKYLSTWLFDNWAYVSLDDTELQNVVQEILFNSDWLSIAKSQKINTKNWDEVSKWIEDNYITAIANIDDDNVKSALANLYVIPTDEQSISKYVEQFNTALDTINEYCKENGIKIPINVSDNTYLDAYNRLKNSIRQITDDHGITDREEYSYLMNEVDFKSFTLAQAELWLEATRGAENAAQAIEMWKAKLAEMKEDPFSLSDIFSLESAESTLTTLGKISESINTIQNAYKTLADAIDEYNDEGAFSIDTLQSVISLGDDWLDYLVDEEGKLKLNKESLEQLTQSRLNDMRIQAINNVIDNVSKIENDATANDYLKSTNYALAESYEELAEAKLEDARASMEAAVAAGTLSQENMDAAMKKAEADIEKINKLFKNTDISVWSITGKNKTSGSKADTTKEFDWIEQAIENVKKEIQSLDDIANSSYSTFSQKNAALAKEIGKVSEEIALQQKAYEEYMRKADSIGLGEDYKVLVRDGAINIENISDEDLQKRISDYQQWHEKAVAVSDAISGLNEQLKDLHVRGYELRAERLEDLLNNASITEKQYLEEMKSLYKEYYENQVEYAQKAHEAKLTLLEKEKSYLNSVAGAASSLLDREIDKIRNNAEAQEKPLKNQIDAYNEQIDLLNKKKKPLQDELDALEDKARDENLILDLQQKQYNLKRLENQRTKLVYTADQGMIYTSDSSAIRDAKKDVDSAKLEIQKNDIQKQIDALDDEIDRYNDLIDLVNDQIDAVNSAADAQINALEKVKNKWQEVIDQQEYAENISLLTGEFGTDAIEKLLSGNDDDLLAQWKNSYVNTLAGLDMETQGYIGNMTQQIASLYHVDLSVLQSQFQGVKDSVASLDNTIRDETDTAANAFDQHTDKLTNEVAPAIQSAATEMDTFNESAQIVESCIEKANATLSVFSETASKLPVDVFNSMAQSAQSLSGALDRITHTASGALDHIANTAIGSTSTQLKDILSDANGIVDSMKHGNAYGDGTPGLAHDEENALRSEYGQPELTVYPDGTTELTTEPVLGNLPKGTVVYNEEQTKELLNNKTDATGHAYAEGTAEGTIVTPDGIVLTPLQPGDEMYDMVQKWNVYLDSINHNVEKLAPNSMYDHNRQMHEIVNQINNVSNVVNNRNASPITVGDINITCPGITSQEVARQVGIKVNDMFNGLHLEADQRSRMR